MPAGKLFFLPSRHWFPSGWTTNMITTGSRKEVDRDRVSQMNLQTWTEVFWKWQQGSEMSYRLGDSRCCGHPGGSCTPGSGSSSCIRPPPGWCCCHTSDRSCSARAMPTAIEPEPRFLEEDRTESNQKGFDSISQTWSFHSLPASSSLNFSRSLLGDFGK